MSYERHPHFSARSAADPHPGSHRGGRLGVGLSLAALALALFLAAAASPVGATQYYLGLDSPTTLGGVTYTPSQILRRTGGGAYLLENTFPDEVLLASMVRTPEGKWLLSLAAPFVGTSPEDLTIETRDLVLYDPLNESESMIAFDGSAAGVPDSAVIDAVLYDPITDQIAVSFDESVTLAGVTYDPSDLVAVGAGFSLFWSGAAAGVPAGVNLVGAEVDSGGGLALTFDVPITLGGTTFVPGQLVRWSSGTGFSLLASDPAWPPSSVLADFGFLPAAGEVPAGDGGSVALTVAPAAGGAITLNWGASCASTDTDYAVYEGTLGAPFATHVPVTCSTAGATSWTFTPTPGNHYYLVVPRNMVSEGSYGENGAGVSRPPSVSACLPQEVAQICE